MDSRRQIRFVDWHRFAVTTIELLVVIAIIGLLIGILLPAVQEIRNAAARAQCQNQLAQLGLALHQYHTAQGVLPSGVRGDTPKEKYPYLSWCAHLLPYVEQEALWRDTVAAFAENRDFLSDPPHRHMSTVVKAFICPSDARVQSPQGVGENPVLRAFTSYLGVIGYNAQRPDGVLFLNSQIRFAEITDGTSNTLAIGERPPSTDLVFGWWNAGWGQDQDGEGDMILGVRTKSRTHWGKGCPFGPYEFTPGRFDHQCDAFHFWSPHSGGANFVFCDGSVRLVKYKANSILPDLASRTGHESVSIPD